MRFVARVALLVALWLLAWGDVSLANIVSGVAVASALLVAFPPARRAGRTYRVSLTGAAQFAGYIGAQLLTSNVLMIREILRPRLAVRPGVLRHQLRRPSDEIVTVMTTVIALSPGTMTVDVEPDSSAIYVHFLFLRDVAASRAVLVRLEEFARHAIVAPPDSLTAVPKEPS